MGTITPVLSSYGVAKNVMSGLRFPSDRRFACFANQRFACFANRRDCKAPSDSFGLLRTPSDELRFPSDRRFAYPEGIANRRFARRRALQYGGLESGAQTLHSLQLRRRKGTGVPFSVVESVALHNSVTYPFHQLRAIGVTPTRYRAEHCISTKMK